MDHKFASAVILFALLAPLSAGQAHAGERMARLGAEQDAAQNSDANEAAIEQYREGRYGELQRGRRAYTRAWGRWGRNFLRAGSEGNVATTDQTGSSNVGGIRQLGQNLTASVTQDGTGNAAYVRQFGRGSAATISQTGSDNTACVIQIGRVSTDISQTGGQSLGVLQTPRGTREIPVEACSLAASSDRGGLSFGAWRR